MPRGIFQLVVDTALVPHGRRVFGANLPAAPGCALKFANGRPARPLLSPKAKEPTDLKPRESNPSELALNAYERILRNQGLPSLSIHLHSVDPSAVTVQHLSIAPIV